ncbi:MAG: hypothetical protein CMJ59_24885, partial [Planctomycetaceae bacterium]|nr:hypothetical protein [Planctomycetaceae bacterium]
MHLLPSGWVSRLSISRRTGRLGDDDPPHGRFWGSLQAHPGDDRQAAGRHLLARRGGEVAQVRAAPGAARPG